MPTTCAVYGCNSRDGRDKDVKFFEIPFIHTSGILKKYSEERHKRWITVLKRQDLVGRNVKSMRVCSKHFVSGKSAKLLDRHNVDWVPSLQMGYSSITLPCSREAGIKRKERLDRREKRSQNQLKNSESNNANDANAANDSNDANDLTLQAITGHDIYNAPANNNVDILLMDIQELRKWKGGSIEPHPTEKALILNYKLEAAVFGEPGDPMLEESKNCQRIIRLKSLNSKTDIAALAKEVVEKCDIIHKSQLSDVEQIIYYLKNRKDSPTENNGTMSRPMSKYSLPAADGMGKATNNTPSSSQTPETATIRNVDEYVEYLYEDLPERIRGSALILQLARNPDNLEELDKNEAVLSALARVLREDWRTSLDLSTNIIYVFFCFSTYTKFHQVIVQHRIGSLCMDVIDFELKRYDTMRNDLETRKNPDNQQQQQQSKLKIHETNKSADYLDTLMNEEKPREMEPPRRRIPELKQRPKSGNWSNSQTSLSSASSSMSSSLIKSQTLNNSYHDSLSASAGTTPNLINSNSNNVSVESLTTTTTTTNDPTRMKEEYERLNKSLKLFARTQEQLFRVAFYLLLNIAENVKFEEKMRKKNIIKMLIKSLERQNIDLLILNVTFLKKLSIVRDNKNEMLELNLVEKLPRLLQSTHADLIQVTLKLIFNLSFDGGLRAKMIRVGLLSKLVTFLSDDKHHGIVIRVLYHMSLDDKIKSMFTYTECIPLTTDMLILNLQPKADLDLIALCINLALNKRNAQLMIENDRLHTLMTRAFKYQDSLLMKMIRNISQHLHLRHYFVPFVGDLAKILTVCDDESFTVECLGILGNLSLPDLEYSHILHDFNLIPWVRNVLVPGKSCDDLVLDTVIFLGTCACDEFCAMLLCKADVILSLIALLKAKQEDDEMVLQIIFVFQQILRNESTRDYMIKETESPAYLIDLMHDKNPEIRKVCDFCLDIIAITDSDWASRIKLEKFRNHNSQWLNMVESQQTIEDGTYYGPLVDEEDLELPPYLTSDYLDHCMLYHHQTEDIDNNNVRTTSAMSNYSRPISRYSRDLDEFDTSSTKSRQSNNNNNNDENRFNQLKSVDILTEFDQ